MSLQELESVWGKLTPYLLRNCLEKSLAVPKDGWDITSEQQVHQLVKMSQKLGLEYVHLLMDENNEIDEEEMQRYLELGPQKYFAQLPLGQLLSFSDTLGLDQKDDHDTFVLDVAEEVVISGTQVMLELLTLNLLRRICKRLEIDSAGRKDDVVEQLLEHIFALSDKELNVPEEDSIPEELRGITHGISESQLSRKYKVVQLKEWLKLHSLPVDGRKAALVRRVRSALAEQAEG